MNKRIKVDFYAVDRKDYMKKTEKLLQTLSEYGKVLSYEFFQDSRNRYVDIKFSSCCSKDELSYVISKYASDFEILC